MGKKQLSSIILAIVISLFLVASARPQRVTALPDGLLFPVLGQSTYSNDFLSPRADGPHYATDIIATKGQKVVSATDGTITYAPAVQPSWGYMVTVRDADGYKYDYIHLNNDNPGTDDGVASAFAAYGPDIKPGNPIKKGQLLGYVGDSGNAESTVPHLHFEITGPQGNKINPYDHLPQAQRITSPGLYPALSGEALPYGPAVGAPVNITSGNFDDDNLLEFVSAAGAGGGPHVRIFDTDLSGIDGGGFNAYDASFKGGVNVAAGDINGDGIDEIITGTGPQSSTHVAVFDRNGTYLNGFFAYPGFNTGVNVAAGDINGDGIDEIITGPGLYSSTHVKVFSFLGQELSSFFAYPGYNVGVDVAVGDVIGDPQKEIVTSPGPGGGSHVAIFNPYGTYLNGYFVYPGFYGGTRVDVGKTNSRQTKDVIVTAPWTIGGPDIRAHDFYGTMLSNGNTYESWWSGSWDVAIGSNEVKISTGGNRRSSLRPVTLR